MNNEASYDIGLTFQVQLLYVVCSCLNSISNTRYRRNNKHSSNKAVYIYWEYWLYYQVQFKGSINWIPYNYHNHKLQLFPSTWVNV